MNLLNQGYFVHCRYSVKEMCCMLVRPLESLLLVIAYLALLYLCDVSCLIYSRNGSLVILKKNNEKGYNT